MKVSKKKKAAKVVEKELKAARKAEKAAKMKKKLVLLMLMAGGGAVAAAVLLKGKPTPGSGKVKLADDDPNGISAMMGQLMEVYMQEAAKKAVADKMNVSIAIQDITSPDISTTITFKGSDITVANGVAPDAGIYIGTELGLLLSMSGAGQGLQMLKWLGTEDGKNLLNAFKEGRFKVKGAVTHAGQMMKLQALLAPDPD
jgi:hypothetical protein